MTKTKNLLIVLLLAVICLAVMLVFLRHRYPVGKTVKTPVKISHQIEEYDNWAVFADNNTLETAAASQKEEVGKYARKMIELSEFAELSEEIADLSGLELRFRETVDLGYFILNSWRFGFVYEIEENLFRYVGVFPAEQMYYSGLTLSQYRVNLSG